MGHLVDALRDRGCDMSGAMERFMDDEDFYLEMFKMVIFDPAFQRLGVALREKDAKTAFECSHLLKGLVGNMGFTPMFNILKVIVEPLRLGDDADLQPAYDKLMALHADYVSLI